jgi:hypothetical protein
MFKRLAPWIRMTMEFPQALVADTATFVDATALMPKTKPDTPKDITKGHLSELTPQCGPETESLTCAGFILQSGPGGDWSSYFSASFTYSFENRCMYIYLHTANFVDAPLFSNSIDICKFGGSGPSPFLLPSAIVKDRLQKEVRRLVWADDEIAQHERSMGVTRDYHSDVDVRTVDYSALSRAINSLNTNLAWTAHSCKCTERLLQFMDSVVVRYRALATENGISNDEALEVEQSLLNSHAFLRSWNHGLIDWQEYLSKRLQALSQNVGLCPISGVLQLSLARYTVVLPNVIQPTVSALAEQALSLLKRHNKLQSPLRETVPLCVLLRPSLSFSYPALSRQ